MSTRFAPLAALGMTALGVMLAAGCEKRWPVLEEVAHASPAPASALASGELRAAPPSNAIVEPSSQDPTAAASAPTPAPSSRLARCALPPLPPPAPKPRASCDPTHPTERISLYHLTDLHAHWQPQRDGHSPVAQLRRFIDKKRVETGGRTLFFDGGDDLEKGTIAELRSNGEATVRVVDELGLDARTLGNHDFAYGIDSVLLQAASAHHDVLASNIEWMPPPGTPEANRTFGGKRYVVYEVGCVRIGVFGLTINPYDETDERVDASYLGAFAQTHDVGDADRYVRTAAEIVRELREEENVDLVVAVDHLGAGRDRAILDGVPGLDIALSGHDHIHIPGHVDGRYGTLVAPGGFMRDEKGVFDPRISEVVVDVDAKQHGSRIVSAQTLHALELGPADETVDADVRAMMHCLAPDADAPVAELKSMITNGNESSWTPILDAALAKNFPRADAFLYEAWTYGGIVKGDLPRGTVSAQQLVDFAFVEKQRAGGPGFTAFARVPVSSAQLSSICSAPLRDNPQHMHRVCPSAASIVDGRDYELVIERRPLFSPELAFIGKPRDWPDATTTIGAPIEAWELLYEYARVRGRACKALDTDATTTCFPDL